MIGVALRKFMITAGSAAVLAAVQFGAANASTLPTLNPSVTAEKSANIGGTVLVTSSFVIPIPTYAQGSTQYPLAVTESSTGPATLDFDYYFNLAGPAKLVASVEELPLTKQSWQLNNTAAGFELFKVVGLTKTLVAGGSFVPGTSSPTVKPETLTYANLPSAEYVLQVLGSISTVYKGVSTLSGSLKVTTVPVPGAVVLFGTGLAALGAISARRRRSAQV